MLNKLAEFALTQRLLTLLFTARFPSTPFPMSPPPRSS